MSKSKETAIQYNPETFNIIKELSQIQNSVIFEKNVENDRVIVKRCDSEKTIVYIFSAPISYLNFPRDQVAFYNYNEFYQYFTVFKEPEMYLDSTKIILSEGESKFNYLIQNPEAIGAPRPKEPKFSDPDVKFDLDATTMDEFSKMNGLIKAKHAKIFGNGEHVSIRLFNNMHDNSFEKKFAVENISGISEEFEFNVFTDIFTKIPMKRNYKLFIKKEGHIKMSLVDENMSLDIYTAFIRNNATAKGE